MRLDLAVSSKLSISRNRAQRLIDEGLVSVDGKVCRKPSHEVEGEIIEVSEGSSNHWVARSAGKLDGFLDELQVEGCRLQDEKGENVGEKNSILDQSSSFLGTKIDEVLVSKPSTCNLQLATATCLDIGSSTGGFTQILLERGARRVVAVDVGTDQLHLSLRGDPHIELYENTDIRTFSKIEKFDIITIDVSFISLREIVPELQRFMKEDTDIFLLFKPQFEVGRANLRKTGVPKSEGIIDLSLHDFQIFLEHAGFTIMKVSKAQVVGEAGNQEYMMWVRR